jgi:hypothetical protein
MKNSKIKTKKNVMSKFNEIESPKNVFEFRKNLLKYYFSIDDKLYVKELGYIDVNKLNSVGDLISMMKLNGFNTLNLTPKVIELVNWESYIKPKVFNYLYGEDILFNFWDSNDTHLIIFDNKLFMESKIKNNGSIVWKNILDVRELYQHYHNSVMGAFGIHNNFDESKPINHIIKNLY